MYQFALVEQVLVLLFHSSKINLFYRTYALCLELATITPYLIISTIEGSVSNSRILNEGSTSITIRLRMHPYDFEDFERTFLNSSSECLHLTLPLSELNFLSCYELATLLILVPDSL